MRGFRRNRHEVSGVSDGWQLQRRQLATAVMFLTRIPVGNAGSGDPEDLAASTQYFPLVGVIVSGLLTIVYWIAQLFWSNEIAVIITMIGSVMLTGGFHEDGLADVADSAGAWTRQHKLEIMRDSRIGTYGGLALILAIVLTAYTLIDIANVSNSVFNSVELVFFSLILAHVLGRWSSLILIYTTRYARDDAANKVFADGVTRHRLLIGCLTTLAVLIACLYALPLPTLAAVIGACFIINMLRLWYMKSFGGITGDCLGAANKLVEISVYLSIAATLTT